MGALSLSFFSTLVRVSRFKKIPRNIISVQFENISHFNLFAAGFEFPIMDKFFACVVFAMMLTAVCGRPTKEEDNDGTLTLGFKSEDSMWLWLDQLGKKGPTEAIMPPREKPSSKQEPTSNLDQKPISPLEGTVVEGRPDETIAEDGTITLKFESLEIAAKWLWQEDRRRKGLPIATTTEKPTTTTTGNPTLTKPAFIRIQEKLLEASSTTTATTTTEEPTTSTTKTNLVHSGNVVVNHWAW